MKFPAWMAAVVAALVLLMGSMFVAVSYTHLDVYKRQQVDVVLQEIGAGDIPQLLVFNKIDRIEGAQARIDTRGEDQQAVWLSARDGLGLSLIHI